MRVFYKLIQTQMATRPKLFEQVAKFATQLGPERLINITHSEDHNEIAVTIWYWGDQEEPEVKPTGKSGQGVQETHVAKAAPASQVPIVPPKADSAQGTAVISRPRQASPPPPPAPEPSADRYDRITLDPED